MCGVDRCSVWALLHDCQGAMGISGTRYLGGTGARYFLKGSRVHLSPREAGFLGYRCRRRGDEGPESHASSPPNLPSSFVSKTFPGITL